MKQRLIEVLKEAANLIETKSVEYNWDDWGTCTNGIVAQVATGMPPYQVSNLVYKIPCENFLAQEDDYGLTGYNGTYSEKIDYCITTGFPIPFIFQTLLDLGMTVQNIKDLEYLKGLYIDEYGESGITPERVVHYLRNWVKELELEIENLS